MQYKTILRGISFLVGAVLMAPAIADADILALYDFATPSPQAINGDEQAPPLLPLPTQASGVTPSLYNTHSSATNLGGTNFGGITPASAFDPHAYARTVTSPVNNLSNQYFHEFSLTVDSGVWTFDSLHFDYWVNDVSVSDVANGERFTATVFSDLGGNPNNPLTAIGAVDYTPTDSQAPDTQTVTFNDTVFRNQFQNISVGTAVGFRIAFTDNVSDGAVVHRIDDVELRGSRVTSSISVPEPAAGTILVLVSGVTMMRRRRC